MRSASLIPLLLFAFHALAQRVTNVKAEQQGQDLVISYALEADGLAEIQMFVTMDRGRIWQGLLLNCTGDLGKSVAPGMNKRIRWNVLQDRELVGDGIQFKVVATSGVPKAPKGATLVDTKVAKGNAQKEWLNPNFAYGSVTDIDGSTYATIQIGTQVWMAENLRTTRYRDGSTLTNVKDNTAWTNLSKGAWCNLDNNFTHDTAYGKLYNWYAVADGRGLCPRGWHLPTDADWTVLSNGLGGGDMAGGKLKSVYPLWDTPNKGATNASGFSALPSGSRNYYNGDFGEYGMAYWWISAENARFSYLHYDSGRLERRKMYWKPQGACVRCIKD